MKNLKPKIFRSKKYLDFIRSKSCLICGNPETIAHHEGLGQNMIGGKPPDNLAVPLCVKHHLEYHVTGPKFWLGIDIKMEIIKLMTEYLKELECKS